MPNWCECDLYVTGNKWDISVFKSHAMNGKSPLSQKNFLPYPEHFQRLDDTARYTNHIRYRLPRAFRINLPCQRDGYNNGGYWWCLKNWGTKWGICESCLNEHWVSSRSQHAELMYEFATAWSPPKKIINAMSQKFPTLAFTLKYFERGCEFNGRYEVENGVVLDDRCADYFGNRGG